MTEGLQIPCCSIVLRTTIMETPWACCVAAWLASFFLLFFLSGRRRNLNLPPGPKPWPFIGNLNLIGSLPHQSIHQLSKKYGPIMQLRLGSFPVVVGSSVEMAKIFLKTHDLTFVYRPKNAVGKYITYNYSNITWTQYGPYWRQARKVFLTELFSPKRLDSYEYIRKQEMNAFLQEIYDKSSGERRSVIQLKRHLSTLTMNVISRMALGKKYLLDQSEDSIIHPDEFKDMIDELFFLSGVLNIGDWIPWVGFLDLQGYVKRMKALSKKLDIFLEHILDEHNERRKGVEDYVAKDMVDVLLHLADDLYLEVKLERHGVKALTLDLIAGGTETSALTVEWAMSELLKKPELLNKASSELDRVIGRERWVEEKDIVNLPYIEAIAKETMRLHPAVPMLVPRLCGEDCQVAGYNIAKGTRVLVNVWAIGRDPTVWKNPNEFHPERFIEKNMDIKGLHNFEFLPFGSGRRMCPGYNLGFKAISSTLANLLHGFSWELPENMKNEDLNMDEVFGLTIPRKFPLIALPSPRLPLHVYNHLE